MFESFRARLRERTGKALLLLVSCLAALAVAAPASASNAATVISFEKHWVGGPPSHYLGETSGDGTIEMWVYDPSFVGNVQKFTAELRLSIGGRSLAAMLDGQFNFSTGRVVLNGVVIDGWLAGAQVHEQSQYTGDDPDTGGPIFVGTVKLMPASAD
jgi:hypothetical protein